VEEVLVNDDIAKNALLTCQFLPLQLRLLFTLIITVEAATCQSLSTHWRLLSAYIKTVDAAIEIQTVSFSPDPPRYLRGMFAGD
jgi:hypothetical protein